MGVLVARAQDAQGPLTPAPSEPAPSEEHNVRRLGTEPETPAPPSLPPDEIIRRFSQKEDEFIAARPNYGYRKTIRIDEFGDDGKPAGQFLMVTETMRAANGQVISKMVQKPQSTLRYFNLETEDVRELDRIPAFPLSSSQLAKYDLKFIGEEKVDEIDCYIFKVKPKRENVDGKYWFPNYSRSDDTVHLKDVSVPVRLVIKWTDFKVLPAAGAAAAPAAAPAKP